MFVEISQNSQANNCARASILIKFKKKIDSGIGAFLWILQNFQGQHFFNRRLPVAASGMYMYRGLKTYIFILKSYKMTSWFCKNDAQALVSHHSLIVL